MQNKTEQTQKVSRKSLCEQVHVNNDFTLESAVASDVDILSCT